MGSSFLNNYFDKIYCLNLDFRKNKWIKSKRAFIRFNIKAQRFSASSFRSNEVRAQFMTLLEKFPDRKTRRNKAIINELGAMGCLMSHIRILKDAKKNGYDRVLILEDDFIFAKNFDKIFKRKIQRIPSWKLLYLGGTQHCWKNIDIKDGFYSPLNTCGTFAYAIDCSIYDEVLSDYEKMLHPVDHCLILGAQKRHKNESYVFFPNIAIADVTFSDIRAARDQRSYGKRLRWDKLSYEHPSR